jgi:CRP-like cAMP-binding protein
VLVSQPGGAQKRIALLRDGDFFGETALLTQNPRNATIRTLTDCWFLTLHRQSFLRLFESHPVLRKQIIDAIAERTQ